MNVFEKGYIYAFQFGLKIGTKIIHIPEPKLLSGSGSLLELPQKISDMDLHNIFIVTGKHVSMMTQFDALLNNLENLKLKFTIFKNVQPNPTTANVLEARDIYSKSGCDSIIAFGGGSIIDCAKAAGALIAYPNKSIDELKGYFKVRRKLPPIFAVPTTSGSGSEATLAAVITDSDKLDKYAISDSNLIPKIAVLDPDLTVSLPANMTASTGMDALTHAIEAYIGKCGTRYTNEKAKEAIKLIFQNLYSVYNDGNNINMRSNMLKASYYAGCAFTRAFVGYVHAIAHSLGGFYNIPHGLANAIILPYVLEFYGESVQKKLAQLAVLINIGTKEESQDVLAKRFISEIRKLNRDMGIPLTIKELKEKDIEKLAAHAIKEANPFYPVPKLMSKSECSQILRQLLTV